MPFEPRPATDAEKTVLASWRKPSRAELIGPLISMAVLAVVSTILSNPVLVIPFHLILLFGAIAAFFKFKRYRLVQREVFEAGVVDLEGRIDRVRRGKGGMVTGIQIDGSHYHVMDAEPISKGTRVRISFLPLTRRIVTLERVYHS